MTVPPVLADGRHSQVCIGGPTLAQAVVLFDTDELHIEAPNWSLDGTSLYVNGNGRLWALDVTAPESDRFEIEYDGLPSINNDHVLDPDGPIFLSAMDGHIYRAALSGGAVKRVTTNDGRWHFLHGVSPDGQRLAYVEISDFGQPGNLVVAPVSGGPLSHVTRAAAFGRPRVVTGRLWIYFNTEAFTDQPGHAQLARIADSGGRTERLLRSETVDWFPHLSPDGAYASYISFPAGTLGHPADLDVEVTVVSTDDWTTPICRYQLFGGQGTLNVNSWSPDSTKFAFIAYPSS